MTLKNVDLIKLSKLTSQQIDHITCSACCKHYIAPKTAACGHTLCHSCWIGLRTCPSCAKPLERRNLRHNHPIQILTEHVQALGEAFEKLFNIELNEFLLDTDELEFENDPTKNVKQWLASSQNHFSAPAQSFEQSSQGIQQHSNPLNVSSKNIQIHTSNPTNPKAKSPEKIIHVPAPQDDFDKIEPMPDTEDIKKDKENVIGPMDIEPFYFDENEYTLSHPRRSSRKRELKSTEINTKTNENNSLEKQSSKDSSGEIDKKSNKTKQTWNNVKRMRKEFSKLNKKNRNKLNVSIEMCKKTQSTANTNILPKAPSPQIYEIDENTPDQFNIERQVMKETSKEQNNEIENESPKSNANQCLNNEKEICKIKQKIGNIEKQNNTQAVNINNDSQITNAESKHSSKDEESKTHNATENPVKTSFYKRSALHPKCIETNHNIDSNTVAINDDIEITIKVGNTIANIYIKKKNDVELKVNTDREIQTSLGPYVLNEKNDVSSQNNKTQNIIISVGDSHKVDVVSQSKTNPRMEELKKESASVKTISGKKNTESADTATAQFEITESVEKELSKVMMHVNVDEPIKSKSFSDVEQISSNSKSQKPKTNPDDLEYLNDLDLFDSESVKEADVHLLKNTEHAPSEILLCTVKTKNKTPKQTEKRDRDPNEEDTFPKSKKLKLGDESSMTAKATMEPNMSKQNQDESEPMNYEAIIGTVFANIDADIEEIRQSQNIDKNNDMNKEFGLVRSKEAQIENNKESLEVETMRGSKEISGSLQLVNEFCHEKNSENVFSVCVEKENGKIGVASTKEKVPINVPDVEEFLTPVMCHNLESTRQSIAIDNEVEMVNDDSDKSVVEETPQKTTSFTKLKHKSNGANKEMDQTDKMEPIEANLLTDKKSLESTDMKSIVNITDSYTGAKSVNNVTAIEVVDKKKVSPVETPLTINKFVDQIQHKSTPYARKSLNFDSQNVDDLDSEQTLCPTSDAIAKTTQEKEFMIKAFEKTQTTPTVRPLGTKKLALRNKACKIAGSCLTVSENAKLKQLCVKNKWVYTDKYSKDLTHLVVGVDDENRSQRSVKYMCALASSIWIISFQWVEKCLESNSVVSEEHFEALDSTGEPGPMRSRIATKKLFQGITFFCMEPFSVLDVDTLKGMLEAAGGTVVNEAKGVKVNDKTAGPAILLAEPENTQEDRFIFLAMELSIVPVNYEWVLNCLGSYTLDSIQELLLCPASLLPKATKKWPQELLAHDEDNADNA